ncbi:MAG: hypothetical protein EA402_00070 [Planctomycetota bacterium]|nr:MAG: hypothetical protein EA402_00070 [Planctomycetota bacterium]
MSTTNNNPRPLLPFAIALLLCAGLGSAEAAQVGQAPPPLGATASLNLAGQPDDAPVTIEQFRGRVILVDFWATWCGPCIASIPKLNKLHKTYADQGLVILAHTDASSRNLPAFIKQHSIVYPITIGGDIGRSWGVTGIPRVFLIDPEGRVAWTGHPAGMKEEQIVELLQQVQLSPIAMPNFDPASGHEQVASIEAGISRGQLGVGARALERLAQGRDETAANAARSSLAAIGAWREGVDTHIKELEESGDIYATWQTVEAVAEAWTGHPTARDYQNQARELRRHPEWRAGEELQRLLAIPEAQRSDARFQRMVEAFLRRYGDSFYAEQVQALQQG